MYSHVVEKPLNIPIVLIKIVNNTCMISIKVSLFEYIMHKIFE